VNRGRAVVLLIGATCAWGATFVLVKRGLAGSAPLSFLALRFAIATVVLLPLLRRRGLALPRSPWPYACGLTLFVGFALQTAGLVTTTPARSAFITALAVVLVPLLEPLAGINRWSWRAFAGALLSLAGLAVLLRPEVAPPVTGDWLTLAGAVAFSLHGVALQGAVRRVPAATVNATQLLTTAALAFPAAQVSGWEVTPSVWTIVALLVTGVVATVGAFWAMTEAQRGLTAAQSALVLAYEPVVATIVSVAAGDDQASPSLAAAGILILAGVLLAIVRPEGLLPASAAPSRWWPGRRRRG